MTNETLRDRVAAILAENDAAGIGPLSEQEYRDDADVILAALGLDDLDAAVDRLAAWLDEFLQTPVSHDTRAHARAALEAALTATPESENTDG